MIRILQGDVTERLRELPDESVHCCVTSPPYWGLRDYGVAGQLGLEATPALYVARIVEVFREVKRVLRDDGTLWLNLGDSYHSQPGQRKSSDKCGTKQSSNVGSNDLGSRNCPGLKPKDLVGIPWRVAFALQADGWYLRSDIIWAKPNPMPESVTDRCTKSHEYIFLLSKSADYFYDAVAIQEPFADGRMGNPGPSKGGTYFCDPVTGRGVRGQGGPSTKFQHEGWNADGGIAGRNKRSVWTINTQAFPETHFATFPEELAETCIKAGTSERGCCAACGSPHERVTDVTYENPGNRKTNGPRSTDRKHKQFGSAGFAQRLEKRTKTTGWRAGCECGGDPVPCAVLDPFSGSGTTGLVCAKLGRDYVGIELNPEYAAMSKRRIDGYAPLFGVNAEVA